MTIRCGCTAQSRIQPGAAVAGRVVARPSLTGWADREPRGCGRRHCPAISTDADLARGGCRYCSSRMPRKACDPWEPVRVWSTRFRPRARRRPCQRPDVSRRRNLCGNACRAWPSSSRITGFVPRTWPWRIDRPLGSQWQEHTTVSTRACSPTARWPSVGTQWASRRDNDSGAVAGGSTVTPQPEPMHRLKQGCARHPRSCGWGDRQQQGSDDGLRHSDPMPTLPQSHCWMIFGDATRSPCGGVWRIHRR